MVHQRTAGTNVGRIDGGQQLGAPLWLKTGFWACIVIAVAVALRRFVALVHPSQAGPAAMAALDSAFKQAGVAYYAVDASSSRFLLLSNRLAPGQRDDNPLLKNVWMPPAVIRSIGVSRTSTNDTFG